MYISMYRFINWFLYQFRDCLVYIYICVCLMYIHIYIYIYTWYTKRITACMPNVCISRYIHISMNIEIYTLYVSGQNGNPSHCHFKSGNLQTVNPPTFSLVRNAINPEKKCTILAPPNLQWSLSSSGREPAVLARSTL